MAFNGASAANHRRRVRDTHPRLAADPRGWIVSQNEPKPTLSSAIVRETPDRVTCVSFDTIDDAVPAFGFGDNRSGWLGLTENSAGYQSTPPTSLLIDYWMYFEQASESNNYKIVRWHGLSDPENNNLFWGAPGGSGSTEWNFATGYACRGPADWDDGEFHHVQILYTWSTTQSRNHVRFYLDSELMMDSDEAGNYLPTAAGGACGVSAAPWRALTGDDALGTWIWELQDGTTGTPSRDSAMVLCDVLVDGGYNRFEIGNAASYAASTHTEIQPYTQWADDSVTLTLNRGGFGPTDEVYLFAIDANDVPSEGFGLALGDASDPGAGGDAGCGCRSSGPGGATLGSLLLLLLALGRIASRTAISAPR